MMGEMKIRKMEEMKNKIKKISRKEK